MKQLKTTTITLATGETAVLSAAQLAYAEYEVMLASPDFDIEYAVLRSSDEATALNDFTHLRKRYAVSSLSGKYAKLAEDLAAAVAIGTRAARQLGNDGGTCNFDSLTLDLKGWNKGKVEEAARKAGLGCWIWNLYGHKSYVFPLAVGQGNARTEAAEAMCEHFKGMGYSAGVYYQMD